VRGTLVIAVVSLAACQREQLVPASAQLQAQPAALDFGDVYLQASATKDVEVSNRGQASDTVTVSLDDGAFTTEMKSALVGGGATLPIHIRFTPRAAGAAAATLHLAWSAGSADVSLSGTALAWPGCDASNPCATMHFDPSAGRCVAAPLADGTACASADECLVATVCVSGACVGQPRDCDDGDACTTDSCSSTAGCVHNPSGQQCTGDNPCQAYACDPKLGCTGTPLPDGTFCHSGRQCLGQGACVQGQCIEMQAPDGSACKLDWAPCVADATCTQGVCDSPTAEALTPGTTMWTYVGGDGGGFFPDSYILAVDQEGTSYFGDWDTETVTAIDACGGVKWETALYGAPYSAMVSGEQLLIQENGVFSALALGDGHRNWTVDDSKLFGFCPDGGPCGYSLDAQLLFAAPTMSNGGQVFLSASTTAPWELEIASLESNGHVDWVKKPGIPLQYSTLAPQVADAHGNFYGYVMDKLWSFDASGQVRFSVGAYDQKTLSVGPGYVLDMGANPTTAWTLSGTQQFSITNGTPQFDSSGVVDSAGGVTYWPGFAVNSNPGFVRTHADGTPSTALTVGGVWPVTELALDDADRVYAMGIANNDDLRLWCWDGTSNALDLDIDLGLITPAGGTQRAYSDLLFVTHGLALVDIGNTVYAVFIGKHGEAKRAWWARGQGGANDNRHSPPQGL